MAPPSPLPPIKPNLSAKKPPEKKKLLALAAILTSTPFLIAISVHVVGLLAVGGVVVFRGGNPLAIFTAQNVDGSDSAAESAAPPSAEEEAPMEEEVSPMPTETATTPTEVEESSDVLALSTPSTMPSFVSATPAKVTGPAVPGFGSGGGGGAGSGGGKRKARTGKGSLFGFDESLEDDLIGTMYDLKLDASGKKPTGLGPHGTSGVTDDDFYKACRGLLAGNRVNESALRRYFNVPKKLGATQLFIPVRSADEAPKSFGVADKVKPNFWVVHYKGRFAAPVSGQYRFVGKADDLLWVSVEGRTVLEAHWDNGNFLTSWRPKDHVSQHPIYDFMEGNTEDDKTRAFLTYGDWMNLEAGKPKDIEILLGEYGGGRFFAVLMIQQKGLEEKMGKHKERPIYPLFLTAEPDSQQRQIMRNSKLEFPKETPVFAASQKPSLTSEPVLPELTDSASDSAYESGWADISGASEGFQRWVLRNNSDESKKLFAGFYIAKEEEKPEITPVATSGKAWAFYADGEGFPEATAFRAFGQSMTKNQTFSVDLIAPPFASEKGAIGLTLRSGNQSEKPADYNVRARLEVAVVGGKPNFQVLDGQGPFDSGVAASLEGVRLEVTLKGPDTYDLRLIPLGGGKPGEWKDRKLGGESGAPLESFSLYNRDSDKNAFFNNLKLKL